MSESDAGLAALILAAGYSSRMGAFKPLLPLGQSTVIERAVGSFRDAGVPDVRVVVGYRAEMLTPILDRLGVDTIVNAHYEAGMYSSIVAGVSRLAHDVDAFFMLPVDNPLVKPRTLRELIRAYRERQAGIVYPCFLQRRGHPPLIATAFIGEILAGERPGGLKAVLTQHEDAALNVEVADQGTLLDIDTPEDYQKALAYCSREDLPTEQECQMILRRFQVCPEMVAHSRLVADLAYRWAMLLNQAGCSLNLDVIVAGGLLHDLTKGGPTHAQTAADELTAMGYSRVAEIVVSHTDIALDQEPTLNEGQVLYLADKMAQGERVVSLEERFRPCFERFADQPEVIRAAQVRLKNAEVIKGRIEAILGLALEQVTLQEPSGRSASLWITS